MQRQMNKQSGFNVEQIEKDKYPESKTIWRINLNNEWTQQNKNGLINKNQQVIRREDYISLKVLHSLHRLTLGC